MCTTSQGEVLFVASAKVSMCFVKITVLLLYSILESVHYGVWIQLHICNKPYVYIIQYTDTLVFVHSMHNVRHRVNLAKGKKKPQLYSLMWCFHDTGGESCLMLLHILQ